LIENLLLSQTEHHDKFFPNSQAVFIHPNGQFVYLNDDYSHTDVVRFCSKELGINVMPRPPCGDNDNRALVEFQNQTKLIRCRYYPTLKKLWFSTAIKPTYDQKQTLKSLEACYGINCIGESELD